MVNIEKNNQTNQRTQPRKIEIYRKTAVESNQSEPDIDEPKFINKEDKIFFLKISLMISFVVLLFIVVIFSSLFNNPFNIISANHKEEIDTQVILIAPVDTVSANQPVQSEEESTFFDKEGNLKSINVILAAATVFAAITVFRAIVRD